MFHSVTMMLSKVLVLQLCLIISVYAEFREVTTKYGKIKGVVETNELDGSKYVAFRGIPYAKKLTESTKFRDSELPEPWTGVHDATEYGNGCLCYDAILSDFTGSLDCLYLNVYVPNDVSAGNKLSSMIWFHGGAFLFGSGDDMFYGADYLIKENVILVTLNYRLGPLGFLNGGTPTSPGNMGLKDQRLAVIFYKSIAEAFGGDPEELTIFGESAGSASVQHQLLSPLNEGLFKRAILESGSALDVWAYSTNPTMATNAIKKKLDLKASDPAGIAEELTNEWTAEDIVKEFYDGLYTGEGNSLEALSFIPTVESKVEGCEQLLPGHPRDLMVEGKFLKVPILIGVNSDEGAMFAGECLKIIEELPSKDPKQFIELLPDDIVESCADIEALPGKIFERYTGESIVGGTEAQLTVMITDLLFHFSYWSNINLYHQYDSPAYAYYFQHRTQGGLVKEFLGLNEPSCMHSEELMYLFYMNIASNLYSEGTDDYALMSLFTKAWTNFAKTGDPTIEGKTKWETFNKAKEIMTIDLDQEMVHIQNIEKSFNSRMCWYKSQLKTEIQSYFEPFGLC